MGMGKYRVEMVKKVEMLTSPAKYSFDAGLLPAFRICCIGCGKNRAGLFLCKLPGESVFLLFLR